MSAEDWNDDERRVRMAKCEYPVPTKRGLAKCGERAEWSTDDIEGVTWLCEEHCEAALFNEEVTSVEAVSP